MAEEITSMDDVDLSLYDAGWEGPEEEAAGGPAGAPGKAGARKGRAPREARALRRKRTAHARLAEKAKAGPRRRMGRITMDEGGTHARRLFHRSGRQAHLKRQSNKKVRKGRVLFRNGMYRHAFDYEWNLF